MARAKRICPKPGCPKVAGKRYCPDHEREYEAKRGSSQQRGYGAGHRSLRRRWATQVATGQVNCARCHLPINPRDPWALDHDDIDRTKYKGPSHKHCNDSAGGKNAHL